MMLIRVFGGSNCGLCKDVISRLERCKRKYKNIEIEYYNANETEGIVEWACAGGGELPLVVLYDYDDKEKKAIQKWEVKNNKLNIKEINKAIKTYNKNKRRKND